LKTMCTDMCIHRYMYMSIHTYSCIQCISFIYISVYMCIFFVFTLTSKIGFLLILPEFSLCQPIHCVNLASFFNSVHLFPITDVPQNYKKHKMNFTGLKTRFWQACISSGAFKEKSILLPFLAVRPWICSLDWGSFLYLQSQQRFM
jgi:hypothetical protein